MLQMLVRQKHGSQSSKLARWNDDYKYRDSSTLVGWTERDVVLHDRIALENHSYVATKAGILRNSTHWILTLNKEGAQQPLHRRLDFAKAKRECQKLHDDHMTNTRQDYRTTPRSQQTRQRKGQAFEGIEEYDYAVDPRTGWRFHKESRRDLPTASSSSTNWIEIIGRRAVGIPSVLHVLTIREHFSQS